MLWDDNGIVSCVQNTYAGFGGRYDAFAACNVTCNVTHRSDDA